MTRASPCAVDCHCSLFRARCPRRAPWAPTDASYTNGRKVACRPPEVEVIRSPAPACSRSSRTAASSMAKLLGTYTAAPFTDLPEGRATASRCRRPMRGKAADVAGSASVAATDDQLDDDLV